ncbi:hypothetical protein PR048_018999 [Dryococelus australis]|uniref:Uncharacterized protein n=1 Tax=Dryococelus australis TaxID=614101 RepID=A0ABQ9H2L2_9NEOP|nr:hypothetical protein PR048_018999 [Dryococelus australis]
MEFCITSERRDNQTKASLGVNKSTELVRRETKCISEQTRGVHWEGVVNARDVAAADEPASKRHGRFGSGGDSTATARKKLLIQERALFTFIFGGASFAVKFPNHWAQAGDEISSRNKTERNMVHNMAPRNEFEQVGDCGVRKTQIPSNLGHIWAIFYAHTIIKPKYIPRSCTRLQPRPEYEKHNSVCFPLQVLHDKTLNQAVDVLRYMPTASVHAELKYPLLRELIKYLAEQLHKPAARNTNTLVSAVGKYDHEALWKHKRPESLLWEETSPLIIVPKSARLVILTACSTSPTNLERR